MLSFLRIIKFALQDMSRNISLSFMTVLILVLMLLSVNTLFVVRVLTNEATASIKDQIDVSIYFTHDATPEQIKEVTDHVKSFPEVVDSIFFTSEEVEEQFREKHKDNLEITSSLNELEENPFGPTLVVKTRTPSDYQNIIAAIDVPEYETIVESKTFGDTQTAIDKIDSITRQVEKFSFALSGFFAVIAFLIIFNTVRIAIYTHRIEISIKKLVGATNWFVRGPYIVESFVFSILSVAITFGTLFVCAGFLDRYVAVIFESEGLLTNYYSSNIMFLLGTQFLAVLVLTVMTSSLAMRRYLRA